MDDIVVYHAGTKRKDGQVVTSAGRVLGVTATGASISEAQEKAYGAIGDDGVHFEGMQYRKDIGNYVLDAVRRLQSYNL